MREMLGDIASFATLFYFLFILLVIGRIVTIFSFKQLWKDRIMVNLEEYSSYDIVDEIVYREQWEEPIYGILLSKEGIRNLKVFDVKADKGGISHLKGNLIYKWPFLNIGQAIAFRVMTGDLYPTLFIEYDRLDFTHIKIEWRDNLKNGVYSELVTPKHTIKSVLYYLYLCRQSV